MKGTHLGEFEIEGNICHKVLCETNSGFQVAKYFDKVSGLQSAQLSVINHPIDYKNLLFKQLHKKSF